MWYRSPWPFQGVAVIVTKLFNMISPTHAIFSEKDYQQLMIIKLLTRELNFPIIIHGVPTIREQDGLAMSSRNQYLSREERQCAPLLYMQLVEMAAEIRAGETNFEQLQQKNAPTPKAGWFST